MALIGTMKYLTIGNNTYEIEGGDLPIASASTLGGIKIGSGLTIDSATGVLSATGTSLVIDNEMSDSSVNPVQNKVIKGYVDTSVTEAKPSTYVISVTTGQSNGSIRVNAFGNGSTTYTDISVQGLNNAAYKNVDSSISAGSSSANLPTSAAVASFVEGKGYITSYTDEKMKWTASTTSNTYYPIQSTSTADTNTGNTLNSVSFYQYYNTAGGYRRLILGNGTSWKSSGGAYGTVRLYGTAATYYGDLVPGVLGTTSGDGHLTANRTWTFPDKTGTVALTSDIPTVPTNVSAFNNDAGYLTSYTETDPVFSASVAAGITNANISNWNSKTSNVGTVTSVEVTNTTNGGLTINGSPITDSGSITIGHSNILTSAQTTQAVYPIKIDKNGHISAYGNAVSIPTVSFSDVQGNSATINLNGLGYKFLRAETNFIQSSTPLSGMVEGSLWFKTET